MGRFLAASSLAMLGLAARDGGTEPTPVAPERSAAAGAQPPRTEITYGPRTAGFWGPDVKYKWRGTDDDGVVTGYRYAISNVDEFILDGRVDNGLLSEYFAWIDTLTYRPLPGGKHGPSPWVETEADSVALPLPEIQRPYIFAVRAVDDEGLEDPVLERDRNATAFFVRTSLGGPVIALGSNLGASWRSGEVNEVYEVFVQRTEFEWSARPGESGAAVAGTSYAVDDTMSWSPVSSSIARFPEAEGELWDMAPGEHEFFVRAWDEAGFFSTLSAKLLVWPGPRGCAGGRDILVVLDTNADELVFNQILPPAYPAIERWLIDDWFAGTEYRVHETLGEVAPAAADMNCARSVFWFHTSEVDAGDSSVLLSWHVDWNPLLGYVASGGNLFLCGIRPGNAIRYFHDPEVSIATAMNYPVIFPHDDPLWLDHWAVTHLGIERIDGTVGDTGAPADPALRLRTATSAVRRRFGTYPDLDFDPLTWPKGPIEGGFGFYDRGVQPLAGDGEVLYRFNDTDVPIAVRRMHPPAGFGKTVYLGFHPYFLQRPQVREMFDAVLSDFGEPHRRTRPAP